MDRDHDHPADYDAIVAHEHYPARGGGEIVADALADAFDTDIVTGWIADPDHSRHDPIEILEQTPLNPLRRYFGSALVRDLFYMFAFETVPTLREHDVVIQSSNAPTWYVPDDDQTVVKYNHAPPRNPFDLFWRESSHTADLSDLVNPGYVADRLYKKAARQLWKNRTDAVDLWVCNSELVAHRTQKYLGVDEEDIRVVYPPVDVANYMPTAETDGYYIALSRLAPSKAFGTIIDAFRQLNRRGDYQLKIVGDGSARGDLEARAADVPEITFEGYVSEQRKIDLLERAEASLFAAENEDFGIVPIESMAAGTPVIGVRDGFTQHQIKHGKSGLLFDRGVGELADAVRQFEADGVAWSADDLGAFADQFSVPRFHREMHDAVDLAVERASYDVALGTRPKAVADGGEDGD